MTDFIVDPLVNFATDFIDAVGLLGVFVLMLLESACIPVPSEAIMLFAGFNVSEGDLTLLGITVAGVLGNLAGSWIAWGVGYFGRIELLEQNRLIHINPKHLAVADRWFERYGDAAVFFSRMLPIVRTFISLPAGVARMPFWRFTLFTLLGCVPWVFALGLLGREVGDNWEEWRDYLHYLDYPIALALLGGAGWLYLRWRRSDAGDDDDPSPPAPETAEPADSTA
jgi:membrane protein DedA with SNARE-associated domain